MGILGGFEDLDMCDLVALEDLVNSVELVDLTAFVNLEDLVDFVEVVDFARGRVNVVSVDIS